MRVACEEIFGLVVAVFPFGIKEEVIRGSIIVNMVVVWKKTFEQDTK
ncbi:MAG: hypothetical protein ACFWT6_01030 [Virgibacillus proomii]